jgi:hypothetical protein
MTPIKQLERLIETFENDAEVAKGLETPNVEDDFPTKMAIVGFSYNSTMEEWDLGHFEFLQSIRAREYSDLDLTEFGENGRNVELFFSLGIGYLLGLYQVHLIDDVAFRVAEVKLSGLIMLHLGELTARTLT